MRPNLFVGAMLMVMPAAGMAASNDVLYGAAPEWALAPPTSTGTSPPDGAAVRFDYSDTQVRIGASGDETFTAYRMTLLKPDALNMGNMLLAWSPDAGSVTVHRLKIIRDGKAIDILDQTKFRILAREQNLEQSVLDGKLTASLQIPGLQIGDTVEFAATVVQRDPTLGDHSFGAGQLPTAGMIGTFRYRMIWSAAQPVQWRTTSDLTSQAVSVKPGETEVSFELRDPAGSIPTDGAPTRYNLRRFIEYSDFATWTDLSRRIWPLYDKAATLAPNSQVRAEVARIAAATRDPAARVQAALALVQDRIRYVYVGLEGGNYRPASADETWTRRFGDCKAKSALLLAVLRELKIDAEPILVNLFGGDGTDKRLPSPLMFNHVIVRAYGDGQSWWLDGTRIGDTNLAALPPPAFRWALPLRTTGAELEPVAQEALPLPQMIQFLDVDAREGFAKPAKVTATQILRGPDVQQFRNQLASLSPEDAKRAVRSYWQNERDWIQADTASWSFDDRDASLTLTVMGKGDLDWEGDDREGRSLDIFGAGFTPPNLLRRPQEQDQTAPWLTDFPRYRCWATTIRLPSPGANHHWDYFANPVVRRLGGVEYWRKASLDANVMRTVMSRRAYVPEISAGQASELNKQIPGFNNKISRVYEMTGPGGPSQSSGKPPFDDKTDWAAASAPCREKY